MTARRPLLLVVLVMAACGGSDEARPTRTGAGPPAAAGPAPPVSTELRPDLVAALETAARPAGVDLARVRAGAVVYHGPGGCHVCHAPDGTGARGVGADLTDEIWWHSDGSYAAIVAQVQAGVDAGVVRNGWGAAMPPRGGSAITDEQVEAVAAYVWSLRLVPPPAPAGERPGQAPPAG
ncbi:MAG: c-type cytochrome [Longimicrobiales bacterium]